MRPFGHVEVTKVELADALQFRAKSEAGWISLAGELAVLVAALWLGRQNSLWLIVVGIFGTADAARRLRGGATKLVVTHNQLVATGDLGYFFRKHIIVAASEVNWIGYEAAGEGESGGLNVKRKWARTCLLPELTKQQANGIAEAITQRFPEIGRGEGSPESFLFGNDGGLVTLGLSEVKNKKTRPLL